MFSHEHIFSIEILIPNEYHIGAILCLSLIVIFIIPFLDVGFLSIPFSGNIHQIFLVFGLITLPLWLLPINHIEILLRGGSLDLLTRSLGFYAYPVGLWTEG
jgi:hypothetical protein